MSDNPTLLVWTFRSWPKAQYLAQALGIPPEAWEIPYLFAALGGPELSVFEAMEKPELGGLTARLKALTKPLAAAAFTDPWVRDTLLGNSTLAVAFHPGVSVEQVREMSSNDGYRVVDMPTAMSERGDVNLDDSLTDEGLIDGHGRLRAAWKNEGADADAMLERTLKLPVWKTRHHSAAFYLTSRMNDWPADISTDHPDAHGALVELVKTDIAHKVLSTQLTRAATSSSVAKA